MSAESAAHRASGSHAVNFAVYVPFSAYVWLTLPPPEALGVPSPKSQLYVRNGCSIVPGSTALQLIVIGTPHSVDMSGPAFVTGARLPTSTLKAWLASLPSASFTVSRPLYVPGARKVCFGVEPNATPPSENFQLSVRFENPQTLVLPVPSNVIAVPSTPLYGPPASAPGGTLFARTGPRSNC